MRAQDLALQRDKYKNLSDAEWRWWLQQIEGRERTSDKLPTFANIENWWYPIRLSCEQCSSELTAKYKASLIRSFTHLLTRSFVDLTGGYGVDTYFISKHFEHTDYVEQDTELCRIAKHNFDSEPITIHNTTAEAFLLTDGSYDLIFLDPARRDSHGGKVFRLEDCTPNVIKLLPTLLARLTPNGRLMLKLSPMLDLTQALNALDMVTWDIHIIAIKNEVKEVLLLSHGTGRITAIDLDKEEQAFSFVREEERLAKADYQLTAIHYLYEPNAAILKAGAYKLISTRFGLHKLDVNTHLYASEKPISDFPGRVWQIEQTENVRQANVLTRNYPLSPEILKKKLHLRDGGENYLIGARVAGKPTLFWARRI